MKVTALIPDGLINEVKKLTGATTITESIIIALEDFASRQRLNKTIQKIKRQPLIFREYYSAAQIRKLNREA
jgi:hypothetical protein